MAPIAVGDSLPDGTLAYFDEQDNLQQVSIHSLAAGKKVILFGVPGAFTPTCRYLTGHSILIIHAAALAGPFWLSTHWPRPPVFREFCIF